MKTKTEKIKLITLHLLCLLFFTSSCTNIQKYHDDIFNDEVTNELISPQTINVALAKEISRITYADETSGIKQSWEADDEFILYNTTGDSVFYKLSAIASDASMATFTLQGDTSIKGACFYGVYQNGSTIKVSFNNGLPTYGLSMTGQTQDESSQYDHLESFDLIVAYITSFDSDILFQSQGAMLSFSLTEIPSSVGTPDKLTISIVGASDDIFKTNYNTSADASSYELALSGYTSGVTSLTGNILLPPFTLPSGCKLSVLLTGADSQCRYSGSFTSDKDYLAATHYTFPVNTYTGTSNYTSEMELVNAWDTSSGWVDNAEYKPSGDGTSDNPYVISAAWNLAWLKAMIIYADLHSLQSTYNSSTVYYSLETNIFIEDDVNWKPLGNDNNSTFQSNFTGNGNEILNMIISGQTTGHLGFFGMTYQATISDLIVNGSISNITTGSNIGGIVGNASNTIIKNCDNYVSIDVTTGYNGGIVGWGHGDTLVVSNCNNYASITGGTRTGGIVGQSAITNSLSIIEYCDNYGVITSTSSEIGGIIGNSSSAQNISYCVNDANVGTSSASYIGGIAGYAYGNTITNCTNNGDITGSKNVGTFIGCNLGGTLDDTNINTGTANGGTDSIGGTS